MQEVLRVFFNQLDLTDGQGHGMRHSPKQEANHLPLDERKPRKQAPPLLHVYANEPTDILRNRKQFLPEKMKNNIFVITIKLYIQNEKPSKRSKLPRWEF